MKFFWPIIFFVLPLAGVTYSLLRVWTLLPLGTVGRSAVVGVLLLCFLTVFFNFFGGLDRLPMTWAEVCYEVGYSSIFILLYVVLLFLLLDLGRLAHLVPPSLLRHSWAGTGLVTAIIFAIFLYGNLHYGRKYRQPVALETPGKKMARPLKIIMLSDLHLGYHNRAGEFGRWVDLINAEHPDLVLVAGDIVDGSIRAIRQQDMAAVFRRIQAPVYACLGNHDMAPLPTVERVLKEGGFTLLRNSATFVSIPRLNNAEFKLVGLGDLREGDFFPERCMTPSDLVENNPTLPTIVLSHTPQGRHYLDHYHWDLMLSGHTHGGQIKLPFFSKPLLTSDEQTMFSGLYDYKGKTIFVTRGIGYVGPGRFNCPPEINLLIIP